jgi:hypothetical protein
MKRYGKRFKRNVREIRLSSYREHRRAGVSWVGLTLHRHPRPDSVPYRVMTCLVTPFTSGVGKCRCRNSIQRDDASIIFQKLENPGKAGP